MTQKSRFKKDTPCSIDSCLDKAKCRGYCNKHYERWRRHGDPLVVKRSDWKKRGFDFRHKEAPYHNYQDMCTLADIFPFIYDDEFTARFKID